MKQLKFTLIIAITYLLLSAYYLFVGLRLNVLLSQFDSETHDPGFNIFFMGFLILAILSFAYWDYLKRRLKKGLVGKVRFYNIVTLLLSSPIIFITFKLIYSLIVVYIFIPLTS